MRSPPFSLSALSPARRPLKKLLTPLPTKPLWLKKLLRLTPLLLRLKAKLLRLTPLLLRLKKLLRLPSKPYGFPVPA